jgi:apolipoprotein D and lipocalin family protein
MNKNILIFSALVAALAAACIVTSGDGSSNLTKDPPKTVDHVDLDRYLGLWYEQSRIPVYFEWNCERTTAEYSYNADKTIRVDNQCYRHGIKSGGIGKAYPDPGDTTKSNSKLKVEFGTKLIIQGDYWIVRLDKDYSYVVVSSPDYSNLWILSRVSIIDQKLYD